MELKNRITINPQIMGGVPCVRNMRMPVATILSMLAEGYSEEIILKENPELERDDIRATLKYASEFFRTREYPIAI
jgi:uncharacterized protein (DUF433 family)